MTTTKDNFKLNYVHILLVAAFLPYELMAYPVFGTKRYGRSSTPMHNGWGMSSMMHMPSYYYQAMPLPQTHYPVNYYEAMSPYAPDYTDDYYYPQETMSYPIYYPAVARSTSKYDMYQPALPYYYGDRNMPRPGYGYYDNGDPVDDLQEEMLHEEEREEREEALPIGQETWYETDASPESDENIDDVNAAFLQNLIMYNDALANQKYEYGTQQPVDSYMQQYKDYNEDYPNWNIDNIHTKNYPSEDEDVKELKMLAGKPKKQKTKSDKKLTAQERLQMFEKGSKNSKSANKDPNNSEAWIKYNNKRGLKPNADPVINLALKKQEHSVHGPSVIGVKGFSFNARKPHSVITSQIASTNMPFPTTVTTHSSLEAGRDARGGQKEVVLMRPATPVRRPFSEPVMELLAKQGGPERKRTPSVYDTIKHLLEMEKNLEEQHREQMRPPMRKRYVSNEESLVEELSGLKKTA